MIPRIAKAGTSFKGAGLYYLNDKGASTSRRVAFAHTENMETSDPEKALKVMAWTAMHQDDLKRAHYRANNPDDPECRNMHKAGRKTKASVYHYSLAWHPSESPSQEHMIAAARASLAEIGLSEHECLMVAHNDEAHPHIHLIVNKIHPVTGRVAALKYTRERLSQWAQAYEQEHGHIWCEERVKNNRQRDEIFQHAAEHREAPKHVKRPKDVLSFTQAEYYRWRRQMSRLAWERDTELRKAQTRAQKSELSGLYDRRDIEIREAMARIKQQMRPHWAQHFREERKHRRQLQASLANSAHRVGYVMQTSLASPLFDRGILAPTFNAVISGDMLRRRFDAAVAQRKAFLKDRHGQLVQTAIAEIRTRYAQQVEAIKQRHRAEGAALRQSLEQERGQGSRFTRHDFRMQRVVDAIAGTLSSREHNHRQAAFADSVLPAQNQQRGESDRLVARATTRSRRKETFDHSRKPAAHAPPGRSTASHDAARGKIRVETDLVPPDMPWVAYGQEPRRVLHPRGMRPHPVQLKRPPVKSHTERATLHEQWKEQRSKEEAELVAIFGSAAKARKAKQREAHGNTLQRSSGQGRSRSRGRTFDG